MTYEELKTEIAAIAALVKQFPEPVQLRAFELLSAKLVEGTSLPARTSQSTKSARQPATESASEPKAAKKPSRRTSGKESYSIDRNLDLRGDKSIPAFTKFVEEKQPESAKEFNAVSVYYLTKLLGLDAATLDQAYTCYSEVKRKPPEHFKQSFTDTKNKEGWVEFDDVGNLKMPHRGVVFIEHDLPRSKKTTKKVE